MKRVFHIDQQCFVIFLEDFSNEKDRFLRIGNSPFFKEFGNNFTFLDLITKTLPPDPFLELEIFKPNVDKIIIGLKETLDDYLLFLKNNGVDISTLETIYAEIESKLVVSHLKENEFLNEIKDKNIKNHSFASFYNNGNIRIFNLKNIIFDLHKYVSDELLIKDEINNLTSFYADQYEEVYKKCGIIHSNKSLFIFSNNKFVCISFDTNIVKDAIRVGINPIDIDLFIVSNDIIKDVLFYNLINQPREEDNNIHIIIKNKTDIWEHLYKKNHIQLYDLSEEFSTKVDDISIKTKNNKILLKYLNYVFLINSKENSLINNDKIAGYFKKGKNEIKFNLCLNSISKNSITLFSYNPMIFSEELQYTDYINNFWSNFNDKQKTNFITEIKGNDNNYNSDYLPPFQNTDNFFDKLFTETIRRIAIENNNITEDIYEKYVQLINPLNGSELNKNKLLIEQIIAFDNNKIVCRDNIINIDFTYLDDDINPFSIFKKDLSNQEWLEIQKRYRTSHKKEIDNKSKINMITNRFDEIIESKKFYIEEQERLKRFISQVVITATRENRTNSKYNNKTLLNELAKMNKDSNNLSTSISDISMKPPSERKSLSKLIFIIIPIIIILLGLIASGILFRTQIFTFINDNIYKFEQQDKYHITQEDYLKKNIDKYNPKHDQVTLKSEKYKFYATVLDIYNLTNEVAVKNGYEKITPWYKKRYLKGKDPDWIYPENIIIMPDDTRLTVKEGDSMWAISSKYLVNEINIHENQIFNIIEKAKRKKINMKDAKIKLEKIKNESHSQMLRDVLTTLLKLDNFKNWEPEIDK